MIYFKQIFDIFFCLIKNKSIEYFLSYNQCSLSFFLIISDNIILSVFFCFFILFKRTIYYRLKRVIVSFFLPETLGLSKNLNLLKCTQELHKYVHTEHIRIFSKTNGSLREIHYYIIQYILLLFHWFFPFVRIGLIVIAGVVGTTAIAIGVAVVVAVLIVLHSILVPEHHRSFLRSLSLLRWVIHVW